MQDFSETKAASMAALRKAKKTNNILFSRLIESQISLIEMYQMMSDAKIILPLPGLKKIIIDNDDAIRKIDTL